MELKAFLAELVTSLARLDFVTSLELRTEVFTVKGRVHLTQRGFLEVYFNERTRTVAVAWIEAERLSPAPGSRPAVCGECSIPVARGQRWVARST